MKLAGGGGENIPEPGTCVSEGIKQVDPGHADCMCRERKKQKTLCRVRADTGSEGPLVGRVSQAMGSYGELIMTQTVTLIGVVIDALLPENGRDKEDAAKFVSGCSSVIFTTI